MREHLVTDGTSHIFRLNIIIHNVALYVLMSVFLHNGGNSRTIQSYKKGKKKKTASYILTSFFHARFLSAFEKIKRLLAFFNAFFNALFACI